MNLKCLKDETLLSQTKELANKERETLTQILHHLREIEARKLFCGLGFKSLFDYCVKELKYSEGQAGRRIQAMRLIKELPQLEEKVQSGALGLSQLSQAQSYFREKAKDISGGPLTPMEKLNIVTTLENKTSREAEKILFQLNPEMSIPKERERVLSDDKTEVRFVMDQSLKERIDIVRSLLGPKAIQMTFADLVLEMAKLSEASLAQKKFGKRAATPAPESTKTIWKSTKSQVWNAHDGKCAQCGSRHNLQIDHVKPQAYGGAHDLGNLRLLCFNCNRRAAIRVFGVEKVSRESAR